MSRQQEAYQQMQEQDDAFMASLEQERMETILASLERIQQAGAKQQDVELLARELGVFQWMNGSTTTTERKAL